MHYVTGPLDVYIDDPVVIHNSWKITIRSRGQHFFVEIACGAISREFPVEGDDVIGDDKCSLSKITRPTARRFGLDSPGNLIEAAKKPVSVSA